MRSIQNFYILLTFFLMNNICIFYCYPNFTNNLNDSLVYFCTTSDELHFPLLLNLIGSIHANHLNNLGEIAVFDIGLTESQRIALSKIQKLKVYDIEMTHPDLLTYFNIGRPLGTVGEERYVRGWYAWKPVAIKQSCEKFPYFLFIDAGAVILKPIDFVFDYIRNVGFFAIDCGHSIKWMTTQHIIDKFNVNSHENKWILEDTTYGLSAGLMGISKKIYHEFVLPVYELTKDLRNFIDDGTTPNGFGTSRHDQSIYSILARKLGLHIFLHDKFQKKPIYIPARDNATVELFITEPKWGNQPTINFDQRTHIYQCRRQEAPDFKKFINFNE